MESIVDEVKDEREKKSNPANSQCFIDSRGTDGVGPSISVNHSDGLSGLHFEGHFQGRHCQAENSF